MPTQLQQKISATDELLQTVAASLEEIRLVLKNLNRARRAITTDEMKITNHGSIAEVNAGAAILEVCTSTMLAAMYAGEVMGSNPAEHVQHFFDRQMVRLKAAYGEVRSEVSNPSDGAVKELT